MTDTGEPKTLGRRCSHVGPDGKRCGAWAIRLHPDGLCAAHAGVNRGAEIPPRRVVSLGDEPCTCDAYPWEHRQGEGLCLHRASDETTP
jgi:hypothetical protein